MKIREQQVTGILHQADDGKNLDELARDYGLMIGTLYAWTTKFDNMSVNEAQRLRCLDDENRCLKSLITDQALDNAMVRPIVEKS